jgi:putative photosynthetic complex assembly protein
MSDPFEDRGLPRGALVGAGLLVVFAITAALAGRLTGLGTTAPPQATAVETRSLLFADRADGAVVVTEPGGDTVAIVAPGTGGFLRGVLRGLAQERMRRNEGPATAFELTRWNDGRLSLTDPVTDRHIYLDAFGPTNVAAFAALLADGPTRPQS